MKKSTDWRGEARRIDCMLVIGRSRDAWLPRVSDRTYPRFKCLPRFFPADSRGAHKLDNVQPNRLDISPRDAIEGLSAITDTLVGTAVEW
jgi:hypothetical protein